MQILKFFFFSFYTKEASDSEDVRVSLLYRMTRYNMLNLLLVQLNVALSGVWLGE